MEEDEKNFNVVFSLAEWVQQTDLNNSQLTALAFDLFDATAIVNFFDAFAIGPTGLYDGKTFITTSWAVKDIKEAIKFCAELPKPCLLHGFQEIAESDLFLVEQDIPARYIIKYAVVES